MEIVHKRCAGLDVHKESVVACARVISADKIEREVKTFATTTAALMALSAWLSAKGVTHIAMEATGVYWKPVWHILSDSDFTLILANAGHIKNVPGRKTDVNDATWIADLVAHGLIRASFVPEEATQELRALMRTRKQLVREQASHMQRMQKTLEDANIKLESAISDILGVSGRAMIEALIAGESDPVRLASLANRKLKASPEVLRAALHGRVTVHHRFLLRLHLRQIDSIDELLQEIDKEVDAHLQPFRTAIEQLTAIPGIKDLAARSIIGEIGVDMSRFPSAGHLLSWARMCPSNDESAGKRRSSRMKKGCNWLKTTMVQCAWSAARTKGSYFNAQFHHLKRRHGPKKAICAVAASILTTIYHLLSDGTVYRDIGADRFDNLIRNRRAHRLIKQLKSLGFTAQITPIPEAA